jgi:quercetin dioxygenase-like cupin family protein
MRIRFTATSPITRGALAVGALVALAGASMAAEPAQPEGPQPARHHFSLPKGGPSYDRKDEISEVKLTSVQSDGRFSVLDEYWHPGFKVPPHFHKEHAEVFYVISGQVEWTVGGETHLMGPGALVYIPPDTVHTVKVVGDKDYHGLMFYEPGGYEYNIYRENEYTKEQQQQPEIQKKLRALGDFNPVEKK